MKPTTMSPFGRERGAIFALLVSVVAAAQAASAEPKLDLARLPAAAKGTIDFRRDIEPIFQKHCVACHGADKQRGGVRLDDADAALKGGNAGQVLLPGNGARSRLLHVISGADPDMPMPPKGREPLTTAEIAKVRAWIDQGAVWPKGSAAIKKATLAHWAFQPIVQAPLPAVKDPSWIRNAIDAFVLARLEKEKLQPSPEADRPTLIRRLSFDLLGLPPTPAEVDAFVNDTRADAYERLVDRLLASPHYGERWGRHWLDLARYGDSDGYEQDRPRPHAWRYRQWVIDAVNGDMPFDQFTIEQLAGDLLPNATLAQKTATGFHRNTLTNREGGTDKEQFRVEACFDRVATTAKVWLGLTMGCAQCHDHKYDPLSQREFYQFFAFFNSDSEVDVPAPLPGEDAAYAKAKTAFDQRKKELQEEIAKRKKEVKNEEQKTDARLLELNKMLTAHEKKAPALSAVPTLALSSPRKTHIMIRGDFLRPGIEVEPATLGILHPLRRVSVSPEPSKKPAKQSAQPNRLDLAHWLVDPANPLTPRVIANWVWHHYFSRGIVATLEDFGTQGEKPSHPELLDHLASELMARKWRMKDFHKFIVTSATYRQSSRTRPELQSRDPANALLARQSRPRFEAEVIRDNALAVSGLLNRTVGGPSVKPPQPAGISELTYAGAAKWVESKGADRYRRGMYTWFQRTSPYPMLMTFDAPDGVLSCVRREKSNTPLQALTLLNDAVFVECAQALARRVATDLKGETADRQLEYAFRVCLARRPSEKEFTALRGLHGDLLALARANPKEASRLAGPNLPPGQSVEEAATWVALARTLLNLDEFVTRE